MQHINLPPGCLIRPAKQKDIWKLLLLPIAFSGRSRNFQFWLTFVRKYSYTFINIILLLLSINFLSLVISRKLGEYLMAQFFVLNTWQVKLTFLLYGNSTDLGVTVGKSPNLWGITVSFIISFIIFLPLIILILRQISANTWLVECNHHIVATVKLLIYPQRIILMKLYVTPMYRRQGIGSALVTYIQNRLRKPIYLTCTSSLVSYYMRLGFVSISSDRLFSLTTNGKLVAMVSDHNKQTNHQES